MDFPSNPRYLLSSSLDKSLKLWDLSQRKVLRSFPTENHVVQVVRFAPGDRTFKLALAPGQEEDQKRQTERGQCPTPP